MLELDDLASKLDALTPDGPTAPIDPINQPAVMDSNNMNNQPNELVNNRS